MRLEEAIEKSTVQAAYRPYYYSGHVDPDVNKLIVCQDMLDYYVVYANNFKQFSDFNPAEANKIIGKTDWEPVAPREEDVQEVVG